MSATCLATHAARLEQPPENANVHGTPRRHVPRERFARARVTLAEQPPQHLRELRVVPPRSRRDRMKLQALDQLADGRKSFPRSPPTSLRILRKELLHELNPDGLVVLPPLHVRLEQRERPEPVLVVRQGPLVQILRVVHPSNWGFNESDRASAIDCAAPKSIALVSYMALGGR